MEKRVSGEILGKPFGFFLLLSLGNENAERSLSALATRSAPEPAVCTPVPVLAFSHSAAPGHLLLPSRPEPSRKLPLEFVLIPWSKGWPGNPDARSLLIFRAGGDSAGPPSPRLPLSPRGSQNIKSQPQTASSRPLLARARSRSAHTWEMLTVETPREGKRVHPGRTQRHRQVALREIPERLLNPKSLRAS